MEGNQIGFVEEYVYSATSPDTRSFRSSEVIRNLEAQPHWPSISIVVDDDFLHDPDTDVMVNRNLKGSDWARIVDVS